MKFLKSFLTISARQLAFQFFGPVLISAALYSFGFTLSAFIVFQFFIEGFALWHLAIGLLLFREESGVSLRWLVFNLVFAMLYRTITNAYQIYHYAHYDAFYPMENLLWIIPIHLYASVGVVYCFYVNARLIRDKEEKIGQPLFTVKQIFVRLLLFPWGLWDVQPRLNKLITV